jgi:hypothetical protein
VVKGVLCDDKCPICGNYSFFGCLAAQEVWRETSMCESINDYISNVACIVPMMFKIMEEINATNLTHLAMLIWNIWWMRNQKCWHENLPRVHEVIRRAKDTLCDWNIAQQQKKNNSNTVTEI